MTCNRGRDLCSDSTPVSGLCVSLKYRTAEMTQYVDSFSTVGGLLNGYLEVSGHGQDESAPVLFTQHRLHATGAYKVIT